MKAVTAILAFMLMVQTASADTFFWPRNTALSLRFCLNNSDADTLEDGPTFASGDCKFKENGGSETALTPSDDGDCHTISLTSGQMDTTWTHIWCQDQSGGSEEWIPRDWMVYTFGDESSSVGRQDVNVVEISGDSTAADNLESYADGTTPMPVNSTQISGDGTAADNLELMYDGTGYAGGTAKLQVDAVSLSGDSTAADNAESFFDGTGYAGTNNTMPTCTDVTNSVSADCTAISGDSTAADNAESFFDGTGYAGTGNTIPNVNSINQIEGSDATDQLKAAVQDYHDDTLTELSSCPNPASITREDAQQFVWQWFFFKKDKDSSGPIEQMYKNDGSTVLCERSYSDSSGVRTLGEYAAP